MFDSLLGRKFTTKCKHAIKCISERLKPIRNRRQAVVNILRKDIADLIRNGNAEHAFGRMDELITEMNRLDCYDMIEKFCESVIAELPMLQKQRECLPGDREAISTLIFAAARFSDLPELCDLRREFTARYGSSMEVYANPEFKDKSAPRTFSVGRKLHLMKNIASEFNIKWDSESFEYKMTNPSAFKRDQMKKIDEVKAPQVLPVDEKDGMFKQQVATKVKDIHVGSHEPETIKRPKPWAAEPEHMMPPPMDPSNSRSNSEKIKHTVSTEDPQRKIENHLMSIKAPELLNPVNQEVKLVERPNFRHSLGDRSKDRIDKFELNDTEAKSQHDHKCRKPSVVLNSNGEENDFMEKPKLKDEIKSGRDPSLAQRKKPDLADEGRIVGSEKPQNGRAFHMLPPPYVKSAVGKGGADTECNQPSGQSTQGTLFATSNTSSSSSPPIHEEPSEDSLVADHDQRPKPRSVRRKQQKPTVTEAAQLPVPHDHRKRSSRQNSAPPHHHDEEEMAVDRLLMRYSRKGLPDRTAEQRNRMEETPADRQACHPDYSEAGEQRPHDSRHMVPRAEPAQAVIPGDHPNYRRYMPHRPEEPVRLRERTASLPPELPDYDELAARFAALKRG